MMIRRIIVLATTLLLLAALPFSAFAASARTVSVMPILAFHDEVATCTVRATAIGDDIEAEIKLYEGSKCIKTWYASGTNYIDVTKYVDVEHGNTYTLKVRVTISGTVKPAVSTTKEYP